MTLDPSEIIFATSLSGLGQYGTKTGTLPIPSYTGDTLDYVIHTLEIEMDRSDQISSVQTRLTNITNHTGSGTVDHGDDDWRMLHSVGNLGMSLAEGEDFHTVFIWWANYTGTAMTIYAFALNMLDEVSSTFSADLEIKVSLFTAPY